MTTVGAVKVTVVIAPEVYAASALTGDVVSCVGEFHDLDMTIRKGQVK